MSIAQLTQQMIDQATEIARKSLPGGDLYKAVSTATGLTGYSLEAPSKKLFPVLTPLRNRIARVTNTAGMGATATHWKAITAINSAGRKGGVAEGQKGANVNTATADRLATFKTISLNDSVTFQGIWAGRNFEDVKATAGVNLLYAVMLEEEYYDLGGHSSYALAAPGAATLTAATSGGSLATGTFYVKVAPVTLFGYLGKTDKNGNKIGIGALGTAASVSVTGPNGKVTAVAAAAINGAVAYNWYTSTDGTNYFLNQTTTTTSAVITAHSTAVAAPTAASDQDAEGYDGILAQAYASGSGAITGSPADFDSSISDGKMTTNMIDNALIQMWNNSKIQPTVIWANADDHKTFRDKILAASPTQNVYVINDAQSRQSIIGGSHASKYISPVNGQEIDVLVHPYLPQGTMTAKAERLPFPNNQVPNVLEKELRLEYAQFDWAVTQPQYEFDVMFDGVLKDYFPGGTIVWRNITKG